MDKGPPLRQVAAEDPRRVSLPGNSMPSLACVSSGNQRRVSGTEEGTVCLFLCSDTLVLITYLLGASCGQAAWESGMKSVVIWGLASYSHETWTNISGPLDWAVPSACLCCQWEDALRWCSCPGVAVTLCHPLLHSLHARQHAGHQGRY